MKVIHLSILLFVFLVSCSNPSDVAYKQWSADWIPLSQVEQNIDNQEYSEYFKTIREFQKFFEFKNPGMKAFEPSFVNKDISSDTLILWAFQSSKNQKLKGLDNRPFQVFWDSAKLLEQAKSLENEGYTTEQYTFDRVWPWHNGASPLRFQWTLRPFGYTAESLMLNWLNQDVSDRQNRIMNTIPDFLAVTYGPESAEYLAFFSRKADEKTYYIVLEQLRASLKGLEESAKKTVIQAWLLDFQNRYSERFQTNLFLNTKLETLTDAFLEIQEWAQNK